MLAAEYISEYHLDRGYESIEKKLNAIDADIKRVNEEYSCFKSPSTLPIISENNVYINDVSQLY